MDFPEQGSPMAIGIDMFLYLWDVCLKNHAMAAAPSGMTRLITGVHVQPGVTKTTDL